MRGALDWSCAGGGAVIALRLTALLWRYWWQRGHYIEGKRWYEAALAVGRDESETLRVHALYGLANMYVAMGDSDRALAFFEECLTRFRALGDVRATINTLTDIGITYTSAG